MSALTRAICMRSRVGLFSPDIRTESACAEWSARLKHATHCTHVGSDAQLVHMYAGSPGRNCAAHTPPVFAPRVAAMDDSTRAASEPSSSASSHNLRVASDAETGRCCSSACISDGNSDGSFVSVCSASAMARLRGCDWTISDHEAVVVGSADASAVAVGRGALNIRVVGRARQG